MKNNVNKLNAVEEESSNFLHNVKGMATRGSEPARSPEEVEPSREFDQTASSGSPSPPHKIAFGLREATMIVPTWEPKTAAQCNLNLR